jgi:LmbE family N-acetylglucosaminyl deacetylase/glycosyltransferase involved in cell wall biosynthesis
VPDRIDERSLIPYEATDLTGARILALAAHPDDETLGAGGTLAVNSKRAEAIRVWIATDGTRQEGAGSEAGRYGERRREEARAAAVALGLEPPVFAGLPDRGLDERPDELSRSLSSLIMEFAPDLVFCPSPVEIHPDHRALAEALYAAVASSRPGDPEHDRFRFLRIAFYEISHPLLPNALVDVTAAAANKERALDAYASQQAVRDYAGALSGLNAYRRLTLSSPGPVEAFRVVDYAEASTRSLEEFRRSIGPAIIADGGRGPVPVAVVVRTRNRPALLGEALESLRAQTARPTRVVVVNDGGGAVAPIAATFRDSFEVACVELADRRGRSAAANAGVEAAESELLAFLDDDDRCYPDHLERLVRAQRSGPEPVVYSDAATVVYRLRGERWEPAGRSLEYSLDFDRDYLLLANYIPLHTLLMPHALFGKAGGFDPALDLSEDWDFLIRLAQETAFRHVRAVTCEYRVFAGDEADPTHAAAGSPDFQKARRVVYERYSRLRTEEGLARALDRLRRQATQWYERDVVSQGELRYQRESHRLLDAAVRRAEQRAETAEQRARGAEGERDRLSAEAARLSDEAERAEARNAELEVAGRQLEKHLTATQAEIERLNAILGEIYSSRTWKLHLLLDRMRGRL